MATKSSAAKAHSSAAKDKAKAKASAAKSAKLSGADHHQSSSSSNIKASTGAKGKSQAPDDAEADGSPSWSKSDPNRKSLLLAGDDEDVVSLTMPDKFREFLDCKMASIALVKDRLRFFPDVDKKQDPALMITEESFADYYLSSYQSSTDGTWDFDRIQHVSMMIGDTGNGEGTELVFAHVKFITSQPRLLQTLRSIAILDCENYEGFDVTDLIVDMLNTSLPLGSRKFKAQSFYPSYNANAIEMEEQTCDDNGDNDNAYEVVDSHKVYAIIPSSSIIFHHQSSSIIGHNIPEGRYRDQAVR